MAQSVVELYRPNHDEPYMNDRQTEYFRLETILLGNGKRSLTPSFDCQHFLTAPMLACRKLLAANGAALGAWAVTAPFLLVVLYAATHQLLGMSRLGRS